MLAADISRSDVKLMMSKIAAPIVANQTLAAASAIFSWAVREEAGGVKVNPCIGVARNETRSRERVLSDLEVPMFWAAFDQYGLHGLALRMILLTGQRPGEVASMRTEHIQAGWWTLPGEPIEKLGWPGTKNAMTHEIPLSKAAQQILAELEPDGWVFPNQRGNGAVAGLDKVMRSICQELGVAKATPHDLRRSFGSMRRTR
jgi:integrase